MPAEGLVLCISILFLALLSLLNARVREWITSHASAIWVTALIAVGMILIYAGYQTPAESKKLGDWLTTLGQAILTTGFVAVFLSLPDTANYFAKIASSLLSSGELLGALSEDAKASVAGKLLEEKIAKRGAVPYPSLSKHLAKLVDSYLSSPYVSSYRYTVHLSRCENDHGMVLNHSVLRYRIHVAHLKSQRFELPLSYAYQWAIAPTFESDVESLVKRFRVKVGEREYSEAALVIERTSLASGTKVRASFEMQVPLTEDADVIVETITLSDPEDSVDIFFVRYPTKGFSAQLRFDDASRFDYAIFCPVESAVESMNRGDPTEGRGVIDISTSDWVLPGCGLVLSFVAQKKNEKSEMESS